MKILVDVDNVLEDLNTKWVASVNRKYGTCVNPSDIKSWDIENYFKGLSRTQVFSPLHTKEFWNTLEPLPDSVRYLKQLISEGNDVYLLTSSHPDTISYKYKFIRKNFPFISFKDIIITSHKQMVMGDVLIDDAPHNLEGGSYYKILMDAPHNKDYKFESEKEGVRVRNWNEIYKAIKLYDLILKLK